LNCQAKADVDFVNSLIEYAICNLPKILAFTGSLIKKAIPATGLGGL
jgi:hypothetical protein